ncbi:hypothetical protein [Peribacillus sp. NPDC097295]|uniref:hypothetical protein n=1 Tax=Peribacillus sp. NPDC097295 TaxID=3364402 RepID=UPI00381CB744
MYDEKRVENIRNLLKRDWNFKKVIFQKEVAGDLYFTAYDSKDTEDRIRVKPQLGTVFTLVQGDWRQLKGYKFV